MKDGTKSCATISVITTSPKIFHFFLMYTELPFVKLLNEMSHQFQAEKYLKWSNILGKRLSEFNKALLLLVF